MVAPSTDSDMPPVITIPPEMNLPEGVHLGITKVEGPKDMVEKATQIATQLKKIIDDKNLFIVIRNKRHTFVEGWTALLSLIGVTPREEGDEQYPNGDWKVTVGLYTYSGQCVGRASAICGMDEKDKNGELTWASRPSYARRSMAATRATGKAARLSFSWIMVLAGYAPTPAEEMQGLGNEEGFQNSETAAVAPADYRVSIKKAKEYFGGNAPTMTQLFERDPEYVGWIAEKITDKPVGDMARAFLKDHPLPAKADNITEAQPHDQVALIGLNIRKAMHSGTPVDTKIFWMFQRASGFDQSFANDIRMKHTTGKVTDWAGAVNELFFEWNRFMEREGETYLIPLGDAS